MNILSSHHRQVGAPDPLSGHEVLHCEAPGLWVRQGEVPVTGPENS